VSSQGFAGFRVPFAQSDASGRRQDGGSGFTNRFTNDHPAFAAAEGGRGRAGGGSGKWHYADWDKAKWDEEYRQAYAQFASDKRRFGAGFGTEAHAGHRFPWEEEDVGAASSKANKPYPDPFAPPGGRASSAGGATGGGSGGWWRTPGGDGTPGGTGRSVQARGMYAVLGVDVKATASEIKKAYMKLVSGPPSPCSTHAHTNTSPACSAC
jgi:hypothetical protein